PPAVNRAYKPVLPAKNPIFRRTFSGSVSKPCPATFAVPPLGVSTVARHRIVVVFPAPLGPSNPKISPARQVKLTLSAARISPPSGSSYFLVIPRTSTMADNLTGQRGVFQGSSFGCLRLDSPHWRFAHERFS